MVSEQYVIVGAYPSGKQFVYKGMVYYSWLEAEAHLSDALRLPDFGGLGITYAIRQLD